MNKQDKKEIMNLIKYKKMLGGRRMELKEAKIKLQELVEIGTNLYSDDVWREAVSTVLTALDERYNKGYQDGFKQAKFDYEMDKLDGR